MRSLNVALDERAYDIHIGRGLIDRGAVLVSDDRTLVVRQGTALLARAPDTIRGRIEVRGLGIVSLPQVDDLPVALVVHLGGEPDRMPERRRVIMVMVHWEGIPRNEVAKRLGISRRTLETAFKECKGCTIASGHDCRCQRKHQTDAASDLHGQRPCRHRRTTGLGFQTQITWNRSDCRHRPDRHCDGLACDRVRSIPLW